MFWGVTLENGKRYSQVVDMPVHISMASLDPSTEFSSNSAKAVAVMIEHEKSEFVLCNLIPGKLFQQPLDLQFAEGEEVTLFLNGQGVVHLTGYADDSEMGEFGREEGDSDDEESSVELSDQQVAALIRSREMNNKNLKRKAPPEKSPMGHKNKLLRRDANDDDEEDDDDDDESDNDGDDDDDDDDDQDELGDSDEEESDEDLYIKTPNTKGPGGVQRTPSKNVVAAGQKSGPSLNQKQQQQQTTPKKVSKTPGQNEQAQTAKGQPGQTPKKTPGKQQQQSSPKTPAVNGNDSANESGSSKKKRKRQKNKKGDGESSSPAIKRENPSGNNPGTVAPDKKNEVQKLPGGVLVEDLKAGNGPIAKSGRFVHVYYTGRLANGKEFDSTSDGKPFKFRLGSNEVIKGWDVGLQGMKVGGTRKITVPPSQGYGNKSIGKIPSNSTLVFDVRLVSVN